MFEILEYQGGISDNDAGIYFFNDMADANEAHGKNIWHTGQLDPEVICHNLGCPPEAIITVCTCIGTQNVAKFKETSEAVNQVKLCMAVIRIPFLQTDFLITLNVPLKISPSSSSIKSVSSFPPAETSHPHLSIVNDNDGNTLLKIVESLRILDFTLFDV